MSLSKSERLENIHEALRKALTHLGYDAIDTKVLNPSDPVFEGIQPTTWQYLVDNRLVKERRASTWRHYEITGWGWRRALEVTGELETQEFKDRLGKLCAAFKDRVKGRQGSVFLNPQRVAEEIGIPWQWIFNVVDGRLIERCFRQHGVRWNSSGLVW